MRFILLGLSLTLCGAGATAAEIDSVVGTGQAGYTGDGGSAREARLNGPFDVAFDGNGNLFLSDTFNHVVRRVDHASGVITTVAGDGSKGFSGDGGPATKARMNEPYGIVLDRAGDLFIADRLNRRVRRVDGKTGIMTTLAGDGSKGFSGDGGPASSAGMVEPNSLALDREERRLFIADVADHRVRVVDLGSGTIATFAGNGKGRHDGDGGTAAEAAILGARAVEVGPDGTVFVLERGGHSLRAVDPKSGRIRTVAGTGKAGYTGDGGPALAARFNGPKELAVDGLGNLYVVDTENHAIRRIDGKTGIITTLAGNGKKGLLARPHGVAIGPDGSVYIGDTENHRVAKVSR